jgi:hypothetical protein
MPEWLIVSPAASAIARIGASTTQMLDNFAQLVQASRVRPNCPQFLSSRVCRDGIAFNGNFYSRTWLRFCFPKQNTKLLILLMTTVLARC